MILHIVRHAEAIERTPDILEEHRYLTPKGRKRFRAIGKTCRKAGMSPDVILTSPLVRAVQTADILAERLRYRGELQTAPLLASGFRPEALEELLALAANAKEVAIVGHEPDLGLLVQALFGEEGSCALPKGAVVSFKRTAGPNGGVTFVQYITGGANIITSRSKALARLQQPDNRSK